MSLDQSFFFGRKRNNKMYFCFWFLSLQEGQFKESFLENKVFFKKTKMFCYIWFSYIYQEQDHPEWTVFHKKILLFCTRTSETCNILPGPGVFVGAFSHILLGISFLILSHCLRSSNYTWQNKFWHRCLWIS